MTFGDVSDRMTRLIVAAGWVHYQTPERLVLKLQGELGELAEALLWGGWVGGESQRAEISDEIADVLLLVLRLASVCEIDPAVAVAAKLGELEARRPLPDGQWSVTSADAPPAGR